MSSRIAPQLCGFSMCIALAFACGDSSSEGEASAEESSGDGDGDGDASGDGDGDTGGDGDGDTGGDGDGDPGPPEHYEVGFDVVDVTPDEVELASDFYMGGYGFYTERGAAQGVADPIYVRTMAIGYGPDEGGVFAVVDLPGMGNLWTREVRAAAAEATGLSPEQIVVGFTHTHAGPDLQGLWGGVPEVYRERLIATIVESMSAAWSARVPARLSVGTGSADNRNRRGWDMTDDVLFALQAESLEGELLGTTVAFAAHPVVLGSDNLLLSRDFCGYAVDEIESVTGAPALYFNGVQGDVSPVVPEGDWADDFERAEAYGLHLAEQTAQTLSSTEEVELGFNRNYRDVVLAVTNEAFLFAAQGGILDYEFDLDEEGASSVTTQVAYFRFGQQLQLIAFPGESLTRNGLPLREAMSASHGAVLGLSGDSLGYFVPTDEWMIGLNDDYEESVSVGELAGDLTQAEILAMMGEDPGL